MEHELISKFQDSRGFEVRLEKFTYEGCTTPLEMTSAYTKEGYYLGNESTAIALYDKGIKPELATPSDGVCSIGFCEKEQKWYGWSHRAIYSFGIGDVVKEGDCTATSGYIEDYIIQHPEADKSLPVGFVARTLEDCKRMAIAFADSVG